MHSSINMHKNQRKLVVNHGVIILLKFYTRNPLQMAKERYRMHALNTNEEMKMKKINYFGKEYTVGDNVKWVATSSSGNVLAFIEEPEQYCETWVAEDIGSRIDIWGVATKDWQNSLRKVEYIAVSEDTTAPSGHPHADLMLKYAMIAQYDDKPWEHFECDVTGGGWVGMIVPLFHEGYNYRLKPQEPKIQVGQIWVSKEGIDVELVTSVVTGYVTTRLTLGGNKIHWSFLCSDFLQNFKRKE